MLCGILGGWSLPRRTHTVLKMSSFLQASVHFLPDCQNIFCKADKDEVKKCQEAHRGKKQKWIQGYGNGRYLHGHFAAVTASSAKLAIVSIPPGPDSVVISEAEGLGITTPTGNVYHTVALQHLHLRKKGTRVRQPHPKSVFK